MIRIIKDFHTYFSAVKSEPNKDTFIKSSEFCLTGSIKNR